MLSGRERGVGAKDMRGSRRCRVNRYALKNVSLRHTLHLLSGHFILRLPPPILPYITVAGEW